MGVQHPRTYAGPAYPAELPRRRSADLTREGVGLLIVWSSFSENVGGPTMADENVIIRIPPGEQEEFLALLRAEEACGAVSVQRVSTWRSAGIPWTEILLTLCSAGSLTALSTIIKAWLDRTRGKIEIVAQKSGTRIKFEGQLDKLPLEKLEGILKPPAKAEVDAKTPAPKGADAKKAAPTSRPKKRSK